MEQFQELLLADRVWAHLLLHMHSEHHDPTDVLHRLASAAADLLPAKP